MDKTYLDGKVKLKEPTYKNLLKIGQLLDECEFVELIGGEVSVGLIKELCEIEEGFDIVENLTPIVSIEIIKDFLSEFVKEGEREIINV